VNLYASNEATVQLEEQQLQISQQTDYPLNGKVKLTVNPEKDSKFSIKLRIPGWARNEVLPGDLYQYASGADAYSGRISVNGEEINLEEENGYYVLNRNWKAGDVIALEFPMEVKRVVASSEVAENSGKMSLELGPLVYAIEEIDNKNRFEDITLASSDDFNIQLEKDLLGGVNTLSNDKLKAIPYYAWSNRGIGKMKVWLDEGE
jgi:hypothetical protein